MAQMAATNNVRESNHSYGIPAGWAGDLNHNGEDLPLWIGNPSISTSQSWLFGFYDEYDAQPTDQIVYTAQYYLPVFSSGNANSALYIPPSNPCTHWECTNANLNITNIINLTYYKNSAFRPLNNANGGYNTLTSYAVSKNDLVVGAVNNNTSGYSGTNTTTISYMSSMGPTADGRIKPDVVAPGENEYSCWTNSTSSYQTNMDGTSFAAPAVTGSLGLITELYNELYGTNNPPLASTLRGIIIHTADQLGANAGPSYMVRLGVD